MDRRHQPRGPAGAAPRGGRVLSTPEIWKASTHPHYAAKKVRIEHLYAIADGEVIPEPGEPDVIFCVNEFGPLNLQPCSGRQWAAIGEDRMFGHIKPRKAWGRFLEFCRYLRTLYPRAVRIAIICDNFSPHLTTNRDTRIGAWAAASNVEIAYTPTNSSWLYRVEAQFTACGTSRWTEPTMPATASRPA